MHYSFRFLLAALAVWRLAHLVAYEHGPWDMLHRLRRRLSNHALGRVAACFYCLSLWIAVPLAWFLRFDLAESIVGWFALSGAAILLERITNKPVELKIEEESRWDVVANR
jgi:hypothetical protein